eukprot:s4613_g3.t1
MASDGAAPPTSAAEAPAPADVPEAAAAPAESADPQEASAVAMDTTEAATATEAQAAPEPPKVPEPPKELEESAADITGPTLKAEVAFNTEDTTMNVMPSQRGNLLMMLTDGGMQYLLAGARANVGMKAGRYFYEVRIVEILDPFDAQGPYSRVVQPRNLLRLGFCTSASSLFVGDTEDSVGFDSEGHFIHSRTFSAGATQRFGRDQVMGVLLNLDASSANANTISLFRDGMRASQPMPLPENLKGKTLFPAVTFRNISLSLNFGPAPKADFPFKCHMLGKGAMQDLEIAKATSPKDGKFEAKDVANQQTLTEMTEAMNCLTTKGSVTMGGWISDKDSPAKDDIWWFQAVILPETIKDGNPTSCIAALEMLGSLLLTSLLLQWADDQGNIYSLLSQQTRNAPAGILGSGPLCADGTARATPRMNHPGSWWSPIGLPSDCKFHPIL